MWYSGGWNHFRTKDLGGFLGDMYQEDLTMARLDDSLVGTEGCERHCQAGHDRAPKAPDDISKTSMWDFFEETRVMRVTAED